MSWQDRIVALQKARQLGVQGMAEVLNCDPETVVSIRIGAMADTDIPTYIRTRIMELEKDAGATVAPVKQQLDLVPEEQPKRWTRAQHRGGGKYMRSLRQTAGMTQEEFGAYFCADAGTIETWERGKQDIPANYNSRLIDLGKRMERDGSIPPPEVYELPKDVPLFSFPQVEAELQRLRVELEVNQQRWNDHLMIAFWWRVATLGNVLMIGLHILFSR